ncbi:efflux RND transporter permease subunit [Caulobacter sp. S45]|uniref:efflux RND transporter permease subunit n=1 Tax=Caulobacter sp. S45 TaxID=1641861 RepID=UPI00131CD10E|nr:efflux RND transporter permease subunit [Caulobacter sp. S45]
MLSRLIRGTLHHPRLIVAVGAVLLVYGATTARTEKLETFPSLSPAQASVETEAPGMVAEQVEQLVTRPIENAVIGARGVAAVHSQSVQGLSIITLDFQEGAAPERVRQAISEGLAQTAGLLPGGVGAPRLSPLTSGQGQALDIGFTSANLTPMALRDLVEWTVRPRLLSVAGVADARVFGGETRRIEVRARAGDLSDSDLGYADVFNAVRIATGVAGAGFIDTPNQRIQIEPHGQALTATDVAAGQIQVVGSAPVRISDVADVVDTPAPAFGDALIDGRPGVLVSIAQRYGANTIDTIHAVDEVLASLTPGLQKQGVVVRAELDRPAGFIDGAVREIIGELLVGVLLLAILLAVFLRDWRAALISIVGVPFALLAAVVAIEGLGWTLNTMTLGGLAVALGLIVDDAVIDVENIVSRLRDAEAHHASRPHAVLMASLAVRAPVIYVTLMVGVALVPVMLMGGVQGALLRPLAVSIVIASLASLVVAIVFTPPLALLFLKHIRPDAEPRLLVGVKTRYEGLLSRIDRAPWAALGVGVTALVVTAVLAATFKPEFLPGFHGDQLTAEIRAPASTSMAVMKSYGERITRDLLADRDVAGVSQRIGRAETGAEAWGPDRARFDISLKPGLSSPAQDAVEGRVRRLVDVYPGLRPEVRSSIGVSALGQNNDGRLQVRVYGNDLDALDPTADRVAQALSATPGVRDVSPSTPAAAPVVRVDLNFQRLAIYGLSAADVLNTVQTAFEGRRAAQVYENGRAIDIAVTAQASIRTDPESVGDLLLRSSSGISAPLNSVANVYLTDGRARIEHDGGLRSETVLARLSDASPDALHRLESRITKAVSPPPNVFLEFITPKNGFDPSHRLLTNALLAGAGVIVLLLLSFGDARSCAIILASTLFGMVGGVIAIALMGGVLSLGAVMGFFALFGLSARNAALLISRVEELVSVRRQPWSAKLVRRAARDRFSPIVISAVMITAALLPFAIRSGQPGHEILGPMVLVILGGLATSTLMSLLLSPAIVARAWRPRTARAAMPDPETGGGTAI